MQIIVRSWDLTKPERKGVSKLLTKAQVFTTQSHACVVHSSVLNAVSIELGNVRTLLERLLRTHRQGSLSWLVLAMTWAMRSRTWTKNHEPHPWHES